MALGIPRYSAREAIKKWTECQHRAAWKDLLGRRHGKLIISRAEEDLLKLSRHQVGMVVAFLMGHAHVRKHVHIMDLFNPLKTKRICLM
jgi:hypothetical protein